MDIKQQAVPHGFFGKTLGWDEHQPKEIRDIMKILSIFEGYFRHDAFTDYFIT